MCHSLVMNYGLYKKMEIFVRGPSPHLNTIYLSTATLSFANFSASETSHQTRNDAVPLRRLRRLP